MADVSNILAAPTTTEPDAEVLLAAYPGIGKMLLDRAAKRNLTHGNVKTRWFMPADIVKYWSASLDPVMVGPVFYEASAMTQFGPTSLCIDKRSGQLVVNDW